MPRLLRLLGLAVACILAAAVLGTVAPRPLWPHAEAELPSRRILLLENPIHTDIAVALDEETVARFGFVADSAIGLDRPGARWLILGWGGRAFYLETPTWSDLKPYPVLRALTIDAAVMHVAVAGEIAVPQPRVTPLDLREQGYRAMLDFIEASFRRDGGKPSLIAGAGYGSNDAFYEAHGRFNALVGCNTWTAAALRRAGLRTGWWNPLPLSLRYSLSLHN